MSAEQQPEARADLAATRLVRRVVAQWWLVLICAVVAATSAYLVTSRQDEVYRSTTTVQLAEVDLASVFLSQSLQQQGQDAATKAATAAKVAAMPVVMAAAASELGNTVTAGELKSRVSVSARTDTTLIDISATAGNPNLAAREANAVRRAFIEIRQLANAEQMLNARNRLRTQVEALPLDQQKTAVGYNLRNRLNQVETLAAAASAGVNTVQPATPPRSAISPQPRRAAILGLLAGALLGFGVALLRARLDDRIRDERELLEHWDLPVLGVIPQTKNSAGTSAGLAPQAVLEAFALARTNLRYLQVGADVRTLVVTSAQPGEGKSTVSWNLAVASAMAGQRVLLVDADLRRPVLAERLGIDARRGLSDVLAGLAQPDEAVRNVLVPVGGSEMASVDVVGAGFVPPSPIALLERGATADSLARLAAPYDLVILDTPPATAVADAKVLMAYADAALVVTRLGLVTGAAFDRLRSLIGALDTPVLGVVVNGGEALEPYGYSSNDDGSGSAEQVIVTRPQAAATTQAAVRAQAAASAAAERDQETTPA